MVDVEATGPIPGTYSMIELGAAVVKRGESQTFYVRFLPLYDAAFDENAMKFMDWRREELEKHPDAVPVVKGMRQFENWIKLVSPDYPRFISDNNGFDWQFVNYYFHMYANSNPFGHSSTNLGSLYKGWVNDPRKNFKHLRKTKHDHNPVNDALGNVEALLSMMDKGFKWSL